MVVAVVQATLVEDDDEEAGGPQLAHAAQPLGARVRAVRAGRACVRRRARRALLTGVPCALCAHRRCAAGSPPWGVGVKSLVEQHAGWQVRGPGASRACSALLVASEGRGLSRPAAVARVPLHDGRPGVRVMRSLPRAAAAGVVSRGDRRRAQARARLLHRRLVFSRGHRGACRGCVGRRGSLRG